MKSGLRFPERLDVGCERTKVIKDDFLVLISNNRVRVARTEINEAGLWMGEGRQEFIAEHVEFEWYCALSGNITGYMNVKSGRQMALEV